MDAQRDIAARWFASVRPLTLEERIDMEMSELFKQVNLQQAEYPPARSTAIGFNAGRLGARLRVNQG